MGKRLWQMLGVTWITVSASALTGCARGVADSEEEASQDVVEDTGPVLRGRDEVDSSLQIRPEEVEAVIMDEDTACHAIIDTYHEHGLELGCATTTHVCPDMLRFSFGVACMQYEAPTVIACVDEITHAKTCDELRTTVCDVHPVWDSQPAGCGDVE